MIRENTDQFRISSFGRHIECLLNEDSDLFPVLRGFGRFRLSCDLVEQGWFAELLKTWYPTAEKTRAPVTERAYLKLKTQKLNARQSENF